VTDRTPPHDIDAERGLAGAALATRDWGGPIPWVPDHHWYHPAYRELYQRGCRARDHGQHIDPIDDLPRDLQPIGWYALNGWTPSQIDTYARRILETARHRSILKAIEDAYHTSWDDPGAGLDILARLALPIRSVPQPPEA
jgi:replicative DNA helicase